MLSSHWEQKKKPYHAVIISDNQMVHLKQQFCLWLYAIISKRTCTYLHAFRNTNECSVMLFKYDHISKGNFPNLLESLPKTQDEFEEHLMLTL